MDSETLETVAPIHGGRYRCRDGAEVTAAFDIDARLFTFDLSDGRSVTDEGREWTCEVGGADLVECLGTPESTGCPIEDLLALFDATVAECRATMVKKNHDYTSGSADPLANFRTSEILGVPAGKGILIRSLDKFKRVQTFIDQGTLQVKGEAVSDALMDVINYMILLRFLCQEDTPSRT